MRRDAQRRLLLRFFCAKGVRGRRPALPCLHYPTTPPPGTCTPLSGRRRQSGYSNETDWPLYNGRNITCSYFRQEVIPNARALIAPLSAHGRYLAKLSTYSTYLPILEFLGEELGIIRIIRIFLNIIQKQ